MFFVNRKFNTRLAAHAAGETSVFALWTPCVFCGSGFLDHREHGGSEGKPSQAETKESALVAVVAVAGDWRQAVQ